jgi:hypothetical protein
MLLLGPVLSLLGFYLPGWVNGRSETAALLSSYAVSTAILISVGALITRRRLRL